MALLSCIEGAGGTHLVGASGTQCIDRNDRKWPETGHFRSKLVNFDRKLTIFGQNWPKLANFGLRAKSKTRFWTKVQNRVFVLVQNPVFFSK